jgi:glycosyltransferase involved in cell wall biosynthesis/peptidoglycan/xylan/chitin deacetylase (PgdA/CDA1 family)
MLVDNLRFWFDVARVARAREVAIIHVISSVSSLVGLKCFLIKRFSRAALVLHVTGRARPIRGYRTLLTADCVIVGGSYLMPLFPSAVDIPPLSPHVRSSANLELVHTRSTSRKRGRILYLGSMEPVRGVHTLVDAMALLRQRYEGTAFLTTIAWNGYGSRAYVEEIHHEIARRGLSAHVRWEGVATDPGALYRSHDVVVIPTTTQERMGFPLRLVEALSYGKPVVVSDVGEMPMVAEGSGIVFPREDAPALAAGLHRLLSDTSFYAACSRQAATSATSYEPSRTVARVAGVYREVLQSRSGRRHGTPAPPERPATRPGALVVSLDFEQYWGLFDKHSLSEVRSELLGVREAVPAMLHLFAEFGIHATWATVGFLFFENKQELLRALPARRPVYTRAGLSPYRHLDAIGENEREDICHFAPSLIRCIADTAHQEIGTHTFSHYYCLEEGQSLDDFRADLESAVRVTRDKLGLPLRSIVFPRNQRSTPHVAVCRELGLLAYRGTLNDWAYRPRSDDEESLLRRAVRLVDAYCPLTGSNSLSLQADGKNTLIDVPGSRYLRPYVPALRHLEPLRLRRIKTDLRYAATQGRVFHLWWHPHDFGEHLAENLRALREVLATFALLRDDYGMESLTMAEAAERALPDVAAAAELEGGDRVASGAST